MRSSLSKQLGQMAMEKLNSRSARGGVYDLYIYSSGDAIGVAQRRTLFKQFDEAGIKRVSEASVKEGYVAVKLQYAGSLKDKLEEVMEKVEWLAKADIRDKGNQICLGVDGPRNCPESRFVKQGQVPLRTRDRLRAHRPSMETTP